MTSGAITLTIFVVGGLCLLGLHAIAVSLLEWRESRPSFRTRKCELEEWNHVKQILEADRDSIHVPEDVSQRVLARLEEEAKNDRPV